MMFLGFAGVAGMPIVARGVALSTLAGTQNGVGAATWTFDDASEGFLGSYGGLNWGNILAIDAANNPYSGYHAGTVSGSMVAFNGPFLTGQFTADNPFTFNSVYLAAAWRDGMQAQFTRFTNCQITHSQTVTINSTGSTLVSFNWLGLEGVSFFGFGGTDNPNYSGDGFNIVLDNLIINEAVVAPVPDTSTWAMMFLGFAGVAGMTYRRRKQSVTALAAA